MLGVPAPFLQPLPSRTDRQKEKPWKRTPSSHVQFGDLQPLAGVRFFECVGLVCALKPLLGDNPKLKAARDTPSVHKNRGKRRQQADHKHLAVAQLAMAVRCLGINFSALKGAPNGTPPTFVDRAETLCHPKKSTAKRLKGRFRPIGPGGISTGVLTHESSLDAQ